MFDFLFEIIDGDNEGEQFFVECNTLREAWEIADENFPNDPLRCFGKYTIEEAEILGLDTY